MNQCKDVMIQGVFRIRPAKVLGRLHAEDDRWPRKSPVKTITANEEYALAA